MPVTQSRWVCRGCRREWVYAEGWNGQGCPACASAAIERVTFRGLFDSTTPPEVMADVVARDGADAIEAEANKRQALAAMSPTHEILAPPAVLLANADATPDWPPTWMHW